MKTTNFSKFAIALLLSAGPFKHSNAQASFVGHTGTIPGTHWCGWDALSTIPFDVEHRGTDDIRFLTGGINRAVFRGTVAGGQAGFLGLGNGFLTPQSLLHLNQPSGLVSMRFTNSVIGSGVNNGLTIGIGPLGDVFFINNETNQNFTFWNQGAGPGTLQARLRIYDGGIGQNTGRV